MLNITSDQLKTIVQAVLNDEAYVIFEGVNPDQPGRTKVILCLGCYLVSWHPKDVEELFCGKCGFHPTPAMRAVG